MNVNELADELELYRDIGDWRDPQRIEAAAMLRQQQAELAVSENLIKHLHSENKELRLEIEQQQAEIEALKKQLEACALLNYNKGHEDGRKLATPSPADKGVLFTEYNEAVSRELWLDLNERHKEK